MAIVLNRGVYLLPSVDTEKGTFFIRNYFSEENETPGVIIYNEHGEFIIDKPNMTFKEDQDHLVDRMVSFIENSSIF